MEIGLGRWWVWEVVGAFRVMVRWGRGCALRGSGLVRRDSSEGGAFARCARGGLLRLHCSPRPVPLPLGALIDLMRLVQRPNELFINRNLPCHRLDMARAQVPLEPSPEQRSVLQDLIPAPRTPQKGGRRARIGLLAAEGKDNKEIAAVLGTSPLTVGLWRQRILDLGLAGLQEAPKTGRPKTLPAEQVQTVLSEVVRSPKDELGEVAGPWLCTAGYLVRRCSGFWQPTTSNRTAL